MAREREVRDDELTDKLVSINRVAKVVKGGRRFGFSALVVVGDRKGRVGFGHSKAREVPEAVRKATAIGKRRMIRVPLREGRTLHHDVEGRFGAGRVLLRTAPAGTGIIAGGSMRAIFECLGIQDVVAKSLGSNNPSNMVHATFNALERVESPRMVASRRSMRVSELGARRPEQRPEREKRSVRKKKGEATFIIASSERAAQLKKEREERAIEMARRWKEVEEAAAAKKARKAARAAAIAAGEITDHGKKSGKKKKSAEADDTTAAAVADAPAVAEVQETKADDKQDAAAVTESKESKKFKKSKEGKKSKESKKPKKDKKDKRVRGRKSTTSAGDGR